MSRSKCECGGDRVPMLTLDGKVIWPDYACPACECKYDLSRDGRYRGGVWAYEPVGMPVEYTKTVPSLIPCPKMQSVATTWENWKERSLLLHGTTRLGKTRAAFEVARRHWKANFKKQTFLTMRKLEQLIEQGYGKFDHSSRIQSLIDTPFLFIDDLGKEKMTARIATDLFAIIDERTIHHRPTVITTNFTSGSLIERFDDKELGLALIGRFKDYFDLVGATAKETEDKS